MAKGVARATPTTPAQRRNKATNFWRLLPFWLPAFVVYSLFIVYPLLSAVSFSLFSWQGLRREHFVGLENFVTLLTTEPWRTRLWRAFGNNLYFFAGTMLMQNTVALLFAVLLYNLRRGQRFWQNLFFLPYLLPTVLVGFLWRLMLNPLFGPVNNGLRALGLEALALPWLGTPETALPSIIVVNAWGWLGFPMIIFLANLGNIPMSYLEAAKLDGASPWQIFARIQLPLLRPSLMIVSVLTFIGNFNAFELIFIMAGSSGSPGGATDVLGTFFYRTAFGGASNAISMGSALAVLMFCFIALISFIMVALFQRDKVLYD